MSILIPNESTYSKHDGTHKVLQLTAIAPMVRIVAIDGMLAIPHGGPLATATEILTPPPAPQDRFARFWFD